MAVLTKVRGQMAMPGGDFDPTPSGLSHYVPCVQLREGELSALRHATADEWEGMTPLVRVVGPRLSAANSATRVIGWGRRLAEELAGHAFYVDIERASPTQSLETPRGKRQLLDLLFDSLSRRGAQFVPVLPIEGARVTDVGALCRSALDQDARGIALRVPYGRIVASPRMSLAQRCVQLVESLDLDPATCDIFLDSGYMDPDQYVSAESVARLVAEFDELVKWRQFVLMGTSMPAQLGEIAEGSMGSIDRRELALYNRVAQILGDRAPVYGDYCVQHPRPPSDGGGPGMRNNIRYTGPTSTLVARGRGASIQQSRQQYRALCAWLMESDDFSGPNYSWGDQLIVACCEGDLPPGDQTMWRGVGTSHHITRVIRERRTLQKT